MTTQLTAEQLASVTCRDSRLLISAAAGSGKSRVLVERIAWLIERNLFDENDIVAITFTVNAARVLRERLEKRLPGVKLGTCNTLHGWLLTMIREHSELHGFNGATLGIASEEICAQVLAEIRLRHRCYETGDQIQAALRAGPETMEADPSKLGSLTRAFYSELRRANLVSFDWILILGLALIKKAPFLVGDKHILCDEVQDSSIMDWKIYLQAMASGAHFTAVGDKNQSIMKFRNRGENSPDIWAAEGPSFERLSLTGNFRCAEKICTAANALSGGDMISMTGEPERIIVSSFPPPLPPKKGEPENIPPEWSCIARTLLQMPATESAAVLLRSNHLVAQCKAALKEAGVKIAEPEIPFEPVDWPAAKALIALLANPDSDLLAEAFMRNGGGDIARARKESARLVCSINDACLFFARNCPLHLVDACLKGQGLNESRPTIAALIAALPDGSTIADLALAVAGNQRGEQKWSDGVYVGTMHSAKGMEFDAVFLPAFEQAVIPGERKTATDADLEQEKNLAYVAFTRARTGLVISRSLFRQPQWGKEPVETQWSQFLEEAKLL